MSAAVTSQSTSMKSPSGVSQRSRSNLGRLAAVHMASLADQMVWALPPGNHQGLSGKGCAHVQCKVLLGTTGDGAGWPCPDWHGEPASASHAAISHTHWWPARWLARDHRRWTGRWFPPHCAHSNRPIGRGGAHSPSPPRHRARTAARKKRGWPLPPATEAPLDARTPRLRRRTSTPSSRPDRPSAKPRRTIARHRRRCFQGAVCGACRCVVAM
jgi:hypothetical protein